ncbi:MAG: sialate O-acetylesterase [Bacteroidaceae bacterium]|nr:sialate O-acetylesterase [Bacteroidaceae bacterium]
MKNHILIVLCLCCIAVQASAKIKVACVGNSITYGYGIANRETDSYPSQLQGLLGEEYEVGNFGKSGATLLNHGHRPYMQQEEFRKAMDFAGDVVVIHLGINDTDPRDWPNYRDEFITDYCALIDSFRLVNPKTRIIIARLSPISNRHSRFQSGTRDWLEEIQQVIPVIAKARNVELTDFHTPLYNRPDLFPDGLHPNKQGASIMADVVYKHITGNYGGLQLPAIYSDGMVLQRDVPLHIQGIADAGEEVTVLIKGQKAHAIAGKDGRWTAELKPLKAGGPYTFSVSTKKDRLTFQNVMAGEVWLCSGQSNMAFKLRYAAEWSKEKVQRSTNIVQYPIRLYNLNPVYPTSDTEWDSLSLSRVNELKYLKPASWTDCTPETAADFSAVAYYFGRMLQDSLQVPIGLIANAVGGTTIESWIDRHTMEFEFPNILNNWMHNDFIQDWCRSRGAKNIALALKKESGFPMTQNGESLQRHPYQPCYMYEAGIKPLEQFPIRGVIWYQGESNAHNKDAHAKLFPLLVDSWRRNWQQPEMPFLFVQLSSLTRPSWPWFRDSQRLLQQQVPHTGMAVSSDVGDSLDVHPRRKQPVGERLARLALADVYRHPYFTAHPSAAQGPVLNNVWNEKESTVLRFDFAEGLTSSDGAALRSFELADEFGIFHPAEAHINGIRIIVSSPEVKWPTAVRYGWEPFSHGNLINAYGIPASTFYTQITP